MGAVLAFPLLIVALGVYNLIAFTDPASLNEPAFAVAMLSEAVLEVLWGDLVILSGLLLLTVEVLKASRGYLGGAVHHVLSLLVFLGAVAELVLVEQAASAIFLILVAICLVNLVAGLGIALRPGRRTAALRARS